MIIHGIKYGFCGMLNKKPHTVSIVGEPAQKAFSVMSHPGWCEHHLSMARDSKTWKNAIPARSLLKAGSYSPVDHVSTITCPVLMVCGKHDAGIPVDDVKRAAAKISQCDLYEYDGGHFAVCDDGAFNAEIVLHQCDFLRRVLKTFLVI